MTIVAITHYLIFVIPGFHSSRYDIRFLKNIINSENKMLVYPFEKY